ncbi:MAG: hypothetical protein AAB289_13035, partial [Chloroflexota bacterium]
MRSAASSGSQSLLALSWPATAGHEPFGTYEDWTTATTIRADRWFGSGDLGLETRRELNGEKLRMSFRKEGGTASDVGSTGFFSNRLNIVNHLSVDQLEAHFRVRRLTVTGCPANPTPSTTRAAAIDLNRFSDLAPVAIRAPGDLPGDHVARVLAVRTSDAPDPEGQLQVQALLFRCNNAPCSSATPVAGPVTLGQVAVHEKFRLRLIWDAPGNHFLAGLDDTPDVSLPYPGAANSRSANVPAALLRVQHLPANCTVASGGPTVTHAEMQVREVRTNLSAIVP